MILIGQLLENEFNSSVSYLGFQQEYSFSSRSTVSYDSRCKYLDISIFLVRHFLLVRASFIFRLILKKKNWGTSLNPRKPMNFFFFRNRRGRGAYPVSILRPYLQEQHIVLLVLFSCINPSTLPIGASHSSASSLLLYQSFDLTYRSITWFCQFSSPVSIL